MTISFSRSNMKRAVVSGAVLTGANKFVHGDNLDLKSGGIQTACSYAAPVVTTAVGPSVGIRPSPLYDSAACAGLYTVAQKFLMNDFSHSMGYNFLVSLGSDLAADEVLRVLP